MANSDDPFLQPDATRVRPRPGAGRRTFVEPARPPEPAPPAAGFDAAPISGPMRALLGIGLNPLVQAASPLLLLVGPDARDGLDGRAGLRRHALDEIRRFEEQARASGVPSEVVLSARYIAVRRARRGGAVHAVGQSERMGAASVAGGAAPRGVGRREVLRHAGPDLAGSGALHRSDGAAVSRASRSASPASTRCRSAGRSISRRSSSDLYRKIRDHRGQTEPALSLRWRGLEDRRNPLMRHRAVVGRRRRGAADPRDHVHRVLREPGRPRRSGARRAREGGTGGVFRRAQRGAGARADAQAAAGRRRTQRRAERRGERQPDAW